MKKTNKFIFVLSAVVVLLFLPLGAFGQEERFDLSIGNSLKKGPSDAPVVIFEFLDFQ